MNKYYIEYWAITNKGWTKKSKVIEAQTEAEAKKAVEDMPKAWNVEARIIETIAKP